MEEMVLVEEDDSDSSVVEVEVPIKPLPPLVEIDDADDDIVINIAPMPAEKVIVSKPDVEVVATIMNTNEVSLENDATEPEDCVNGQHSHPDHWTKDMIKFYDDDWGDESNFSVEEIQAGMDKNPELWEVSKKDLIRPKKSKKHHPYCRNCFKHGHVASTCIPNCHMCGWPGHTENFCPNAKCLNCGKKTYEYTLSCRACEPHAMKICSRCSLKGHNIINCPDHWRLYHLTTQEKLIVPNGNINKKMEDMWCCNCARKGHSQICCKNAKTLNPFPASFPFVISYDRNLISRQGMKRGFPWEKNDFEEISTAATGRAKKAKKRLRLLSGTNAEQMAAEATAKTTVSCVKPKEILKSSATTSTTTWTTTTVTASKQSPVATEKADGSKDTQKRKKKKKKRKRKKFNRLGDPRFWNPHYFRYINSFNA